MIATSTLSIMILLYILIAVFSFLASLFLCLAVVNDCVAHGISRKGMWGALVFFFPVVTGIVYLCLRKSMSVDRFCTNCGKPLKHDRQICDNCGSPCLAPIPPREEIVSAKRKSKGFFITWIVMLCAEALTFIGFLIASAVFGFSAGYYDYNYGSQFSPDYGYDYDYDDYYDYDDIVDDI